MKVTFGSHQHHPLRVTRRSHRGRKVRLMTERQVSSDDEATATYEIRIRGASAEPLRKQFPAAAVFTTRQETVLFRRVEEPAELDELIDQLLSMGLVLTEVHEVQLPETSDSRPQQLTFNEGASDDQDV